VDLKIACAVISLISLWRGMETCTDVPNLHFS
jgi:hypothetical protein